MTIPKLGIFTATATEEVEELCLQVKAQGQRSKESKH